MKFIRRVRPRYALLALTALLLACSPRIDTHGQIPDPDALAEITPGVQTREQVRQLLGTPTGTGTLNDRRWYYLTRVTESISFYDSDLIGQDVLIIEFDDSGVVSEIYRYSVTEEHDIDIVERETPTQGKDLGILEQLFGDIGRYSGPGGRPAGRR